LATEPAISSTAKLLWDSITSHNNLGSDNPSGRIANEAILGIRFSCNYCVAATEGIMFYCYSEHKFR
jgi:hypothetical protein